MNGMNNSQFIKQGKHHNTCTCSIDDMEALLDHIDEFSQYIKSHDNLKDEQLLEEWNLFNTYIKWKIEDFTEDSHIFSLPSRKHNA